MKSHPSRAFLGVLACALLGGMATARTLEFTTKQVTDADVAVSPDGKQLVFTILGHLFRMPVKGGTAEQLTFGACYDSDPAYSPDGLRIAFISDRDGSGGNVFLLELATSKVTRVTHDPRASQPVWTRDGKAILYLRALPREEDPRTPSIFGGPALCELREVSLGGDAKPTTLRKAGLLRSVFLLPGEQPAWTVVEQQNAPGGFFPRSTTHVESIPPKEGKVTRLLTVPGDLGRVAGSPKGDGIYCRSPQLRLLAFAGRAAKQSVAGSPGGASMARFAVTADGKTGYHSQRGQLVKVALGGDEREVIEFSARVKLEVADAARPKWLPPEVGAAVQPRGVLSPVLSPDGRGLIFMAAGYLWRQSLDGTPARRLLKGDAWESDPALSPDGRQLAFVHGQNGNREVRLLDLESGRTRTLAGLGGGSRARFPSWSGDGKRLVFQKTDALQSPSALISVNVADGKPEKLAGAAGDWSARPHFAAEGDALYFTNRDGGPAALFRLSLKGKARPEPITQLARHLNDARVSPDGKWLAFRRNTEVWLAPLGTKLVKEKDARRLSPEGGATFGFTADSSALVYSVGSRVWRHPLEGGKREAVPVRLDWRSPTPPPLLLRRVRVLDFTAGQFGKETSLLIEKGVVRWIGPEGGREIPKGTVVLDAAGKYAIPGLFDCHVHSTWANHEADPDTFLAYGVTSVRETGGRLETLCALADRGAVSGDPAPRYFFSCEIFEGAQPMWGDDASWQIYSAEDARSHVKRAKERGAHFIKVYPSLPWDLQQTTAEEARKQGLPVIGHGLNHEETIRSVTLGYTSLEHAPISLYEDVRRMLAAAGTRCVPTLAILGGHGSLLRREPKRLDDLKLRAFFPASTIRAARFGGFPGGMGGGRFTNVREAHRAGVNILAGTDSLMTGTFFGASLHWELEHLAEAGLKPLEVLRMATAEAAAAVGADGHLGTLAPGKLADVLLLDADPLENLRNTQAIWRVVKGGRVFDPNELRPPAK